jgi:hypothetical protein
MLSRIGYFLLKMTDKFHKLKGVPANRRFLPRETMQNSIIACVALGNLCFYWSRPGSGNCPEEPLGPQTGELIPCELLERCDEHLFSRWRYNFPSGDASCRDFHWAGRKEMGIASKRFQRRSHIKNREARTTIAAHDVKYKKLNTVALHCASKVFFIVQQELRFDAAKSLITNPQVAAEALSSYKAQREKMEFEDAAADEAADNASMPDTDSDSENCAGDDTDDEDVEQSSDEETTTMNPPKPELAPASYADEVGEDKFLMHTSALEKSLCHVNSRMVRPGGNDVVNIPTDAIPEQYTPTVGPVAQTDDVEPLPKRVRKNGKRSRGDSDPYKDGQSFQECVDDLIIYLNTAAFTLQDLLKKLEQFLVCCTLEDRFLKRTSIPRIDKYTSVKRRAMESVFNEWNRIAAQRRQN